MCRGLLASLVTASVGLAECRYTELLTKHVQTALPSFSERVALNPVDLLQMLNTQKASGQWTEGVQDDLAGVAIKIEDDVMAKIKASHDETQQELDDAIQSLRNKTKTLKPKKANADAEQLGWFVEMKVEKELALRSNESHGVLQTETQDLDAAKQQEASARTLQSSAPPTFGKFSCQESFEAAGTGQCNQDFVPYEAGVEAWLADQSTAVQYHIGNHSLKEHALTTAEQDFADQTQHYRNNVTQWEEQRAANQVVKAQFHVFACRFGEGYQKKCTSLSDYDVLVGQATGYSNIHSDQDRRKEWTTTATVVCLLNKFAGTSEVNESTARMCQDEVNFDRDVGSLSLHEDERVWLTAPANYTCDESTVGFGNLTSWRVASVAGNENTSIYQKLSGVVHAITKDPKLPALAMCAQPEEQTTCGAASFSCTSEDQTLADEEVCLLATGCTVGECCVTEVDDDESTLDTLLNFDAGDASAAVAQTLTVIVEASANLIKSLPTLSTRWR